MSALDPKEILKLVAIKAKAAVDSVRLEGDRMVVAYCGPYVVGIIITERVKQTDDEAAERVAARIEDALAYCRANGQRVEVLRTAGDDDSDPFTYDGSYI